MAQVTKFLDNALPQISMNVSAMQRKFSVASGDAAMGDAIEVFTFPMSYRGRIQSISLRVSGSLGAGATLTAQLNDGTTQVALTGPTTAAAASKVSSNDDVDVPIDVDVNDKLELLVGGANITAAATVTVDLTVSARDPNT